MFPLPFPSLYLKLAGVAIVALAIGFHVWGDKRTQVKLEQTQAELVQTQSKLKQAEDNLIAATRARDEVQDAVNQAEKEKTKIKEDLEVSLKKLRAQKPPVAPAECKILGKWLVDNKDDLKWEK